MEHNLNQHQATERCETYHIGNHKDIQYIDFASHLNFAPTIIILDLLQADFLL